MVQCHRALDTNSRRGSRGSPRGVPDLLAGEVGVAKRGGSASWANVFRPKTITFNNKTLVAVIVCLVLILVTWRFWWRLHRSLAVTAIRLRA